MKRIFYVAAAIIACCVAFTSCFNDFDEEDGGVAKVATTISASIPETRAYLDGLDMKWSDNDVLHVNRGSGTDWETTDFTISRGAGTRNAEFTHPTVTVGNDETIVAVHGVQYNRGFLPNVNNRYYYDINATQQYVANGIEDGLMPMAAVGTKDALNFSPLASILSFSIKATTPKKIISAVLSAGERITGRYGLALPEVTPIPYNSPSSATVSISFDDGIDNGTDGITIDTNPVQLNFVVESTNIGMFVLAFTDDEGNTFNVAKLSTMTTVAGKLYRFPEVDLDNIDTVGNIEVSNDGGNSWVGSPYPLVSPTTQSIKYRMKDTINLISYPILLNIASYLKQSIPTNQTIGIDFSQFKIDTDVWDTNVYANFGSRISDFYLPKNVTTLKTYSLFANNSDIKLHIGKAVTKVDAIVFHNSKLKNGCGFFVDPENQTFSSVDGILFSKDGKTLVQYPQFADVTSYEVPAGVETIGEYGLSNCLLETIIFPASIKSFVRSAIYNDKNLKTIYFKSAVAPTFQEIVLPTITSGTRGTIYVPSGMSDDYRNALGTQLVEGWDIVEEGSTPAPVTGSIGGLTGSSEYNSDLW